jgi:hypothetical protein
MTLTIHETIPNEEVIPYINSELFGGHETARFALGVVAVGDEVVPGMENELIGYKLLRGNVYAKQKHYMSEEALEADGTEWNGDDLRSVHFAAFENHNDGTRVIGTERLVIKTRRLGETPIYNSLVRSGSGIITPSLAEIARLGLPSPHEIGTNDPLPIEEHYPEAFAEGSAPMPSNESSRLISRHEDPRVQKMVTWALLGAAVSYIEVNELGDCYGVVTPALSRGFRIGGMPVTELAEAKFVPDFNSSKMPIRIDIPEFARRLRSGKPDPLAAGNSENFAYAGTSPAAQSNMAVAA